MNDEDFMELMNRAADAIIKRHEDGQQCPSDLADEADGENLKGSIVCSMLYAAQECLDNAEVEEGDDEGEGVDES
jgi:hypothetical protein